MGKEQAHAGTWETFANAVPWRVDLGECGVLGYGHVVLQAELFNYSVLKRRTKRQLR
jgi:hypothetical protein